MKNTVLNNRIKNMLMTDRLHCKQGLQDLIKSQAFDMLSDFFELEDEKILVKIDTDNDGYIITIKAKAIRVY